MIYSCTTVSKDYVVDDNFSGDLSDQGNMGGYKAVTTLTELLKRQSGLKVGGYGREAAVSVRATGSIKYNRGPLFIVNGTRIGRSYSEVSDMVDPRFVEKIRVLRSLHELAPYGEDGNSGIITITTKNLK